MAKQKQAEIVHNFKFELKIYTDPNMFDTLIRNLLSNAIEYLNASQLTCFYSISRKQKLSTPDHEGLPVHVLFTNKLCMIQSFR